MSTKLEIERKWRLPYLPERVLKSDFLKVRCYHIQQMYLLSALDAEMRIRRIGENYRVAIKTNEGLVRHEGEIPLSKAAFESLATIHVGEAIEKYRFSFPYQNLLLEFDQFEKGLSGLFLVEVEFNSEEEAMNFTLPNWIEEAEEVTGQREFSNKYLALHGIPQSLQLQLF